MKARKTSNRGYPCWCFQYTEDGKRRKFQSKSKAVVDEFIREYRRKKEQLSQDGLKLMADPTIAYSVYRALEHIQNKNYSLMDAIKFYENHHDTNKKSLPINEGVLTFVDYKRSRGKRERTLGEYSQRLGDLVNYVGADKPISSVTTKTAERWLEGKGVVGVTKNHFRRVGMAFFNWAKSKGYTEINPFTNIEKYDDGGEGVPEIFTFEQIQSLLEKAENEQVILWVAIGAFAGIRPAEMNRLTWDKIHLNTNKIDLLGMYAKGAKRRIVDIEPRLCSILKGHKKDKGRLFVAKNFEFSPYLKRTKDAVDFDWVNDGLRHSFASYHIAMTDSADKTMRQMGHAGSSKTFYEHYYKPGITMKEGKSYFGIQDGSKGGIDFLKKV